MSCERHSSAQAACCDRLLFEQIQACMACVIKIVGCVSPSITCISELKAGVAQDSICRSINRQLMPSRPGMKRC